MNPLNHLAHIIYPPRCIICSDFLWRAPFDAGDVANYICPSCLQGFSTIEAPFCSICGTPFISDGIENHPCEDCLRTPPYFQAAYAPYRYEGPILEAVLKLKYGGKTFVAEAMGQYLAEFAEMRFMLRKPCIIMPVPLHPKRLRERGFNQSLLLAKAVAVKLNGILDFISLIRAKETIPQTTLSRTERKRNVQNAFVLKNPAGVLKKNILLVDDVSTTGNTLNECAKVLKRGGVKAVFCVTLARAVL
ncbi:MAG: ComF family protein [Deltaproteobacteria bacterium]|nr:ComF family protein [Deltaproteobacteria bacterium]